MSSDTDENPVGRVQDLLNYEGPMQMPFSDHLTRISYQNPWDSHHTARSSANFTVEKEDIVTSIFRTIFVVKDIYTHKPL